MQAPPRKFLGVGPENQTGEAGGQGLTGGWRTAKLGGDAASFVSTRPPKLLVIIWKLLGCTLAPCSPVVKGMGPATGSGAPGWDVVHLLGRAPHMLSRSKEPRGVGVHMAALLSGSLDPRAPVPTGWPVRELMKPGQPSMQGTLWAFTALCLQPGSCLSLLAASRLWGRCTAR